MEIVRNDYRYQLEVGDKINETSIEYYNSNKSLIKRSFDNEGLFKFTVLELADDFYRSLFGTKSVDDYNKGFKSQIDWIAFDLAKIFTPYIQQYFKQRGLSKPIQAKKISLNKRRAKTLKHITTYANRD